MRIEKPERSPGWGQGETVAAHSAWSRRPARTPAMPAQQTTHSLLEGPDYEGLPEDVAEYARSRLGETPDRTAELIDQLRERIYQQGDVTPLKMDDDYLLKFLRARNFKLDATYKLLQDYNHFRDKNWEYYDCNPEDLFHVSDAGILTLLPVRDQNGRRIIIYRLGNWDPALMPVEELLKASVALIEAGSQEPRAQVLGGVAIFDLEGLGLSHVCQLTPSVISAIVDIKTKIPYKTAAVHVVNESWIFGKIYPSFKPFLNNKFAERVFFHGSNMKSLHQHIDPKHLPEIYGGIQPDDGVAKWMRSLIKYESVIKEMKALGYHFDEKK